MVTRKSSFPYPTSPSSPPHNWAPSQPNHDVDSSDVPPIPKTGHRESEDSPYHEMGNPWLDSTGNRQRPDVAAVPASLRPGPGRTISQDAVPAPAQSDAPRPGQSAVNTPRSSIDSQRSRDFWESSDDEAENKRKGKGKGKEKQVLRAPQQIDNDSSEDLVIPPALQIKRKPIGNLPVQTTGPAFGVSPPNPDFASNNPFRNSPPRAGYHPPNEMPSWHSDHQEKWDESEAFPTAQLGNMSLNSSTSPDYSVLTASSHVRDDSVEWQQQVVPPMPQAPPPPVPPPQVTSPFSKQPPLIPVTSPPPPPAPQVLSPFSQQPPLIPVSPRIEEPENPWSSQPNLSAIPSPIPFSPSQKQFTHSTDDLLDRGQKGDGRLSLGDELKALPNAVQTSQSQTSLLDDEQPPAMPPRPSVHPTEELYAPPPGPPPSHRVERFQVATSPPPPTKPPRPAIVVKPLSEVEIAQLQEQRNETYQIKHFNWYDHRSGKLRKSSMLTQNKNGPCPLLALVNALILGASDASQVALDDALRSREQVSLGLIIETLMDQLLSSGAHLDGELPDVDELNRFLMKLRTGMNMNPRFVQPQAPPPNLMDARNSMLHVPSPQQHRAPGVFESTQDIQLYSAFGITTVHGWLPDPSSDSVGAFERSAQNYEDAQVIQFGEEELEYKLSHGGLSPPEQQLWEDIISIKNFFRTHPTQLTPYGLESIQRSMLPGSFEILFRNDHFSTIYKHPRDGRLYTLITDAGYADRDEIIWESLVDISGLQSEFFSGDFQSVSHHESPSNSSRRRSSHLPSDAGIPEPLSPQQQQEQHDADFAMALQLQEEEEQRLRQQRSGRGGEQETNRGRGGTATGATTRGGGPGGRGRGQGNIPIPLGRNNSSTENRPLIPPRNSRSNMPAVNRPSDALDADAPPSYEEAARGEAYNPPIGSPLHPHASPVIGGPSPFGSASNVHLPETVITAGDDAPPPFRRPERRQSAYNENLGRQGHSSRQSLGVDNSPRIPGSYMHPGVGGSGQRVSSGASVGGRQGKNTDGDCTVM